MQASQLAHPERWQDFYSATADAWQYSWGEPWEMGRRVSGALAEEGLLRQGASVLDLGCGPGSLAVPLAEAGAQVLALDSAPGMIELCQAEAGRRGLDNLQARRQCWSQVLPLPHYDLTLAAFFPPALNPSGLARLEALSRRNCALVLNAGPEPFACRRDLWSMLFGINQGRGSFHLSCAFNYLLASGRSPNLRQLCWQGRLSQPLEEAVTYYKRYFALLNSGGPNAEQAIRGVLEPHVKDGLVEAVGEVRIALIWWEKP